MRGETPAGSFYPNDEVVSLLKAAYKGKPADILLRFLRESMFAHMARTEITRTPFFVNSHLLAESSIAFVEKHKGYLRSFYGSGYEPHVFSQTVYGAVMASESDYLDIFGNYFVRTGQMSLDFDLIYPSPWWMIFCDTWQRLRRKDFPEGWFTQELFENGMRQPAEQIVLRERSKLKDSHRMKAAEQAAKEALEAAALAWAQRHRAVNMYYRDDKPVVQSSSPVVWDDLRVEVPLSVRDEKLFIKVREYGQKLSAKSATEPSSRRTFRTEELRTVARAVEAEEDA